MAELVHTCANDDGKRDVGVAVDSCLACDVEAIRDALEGEGFDTGVERLDRITAVLASHLGESGQSFALVSDGEAERLSERDQAYNDLARQLESTTEAYNELLLSRVLTCVYCGHEYPQDTPAHGSEVLTEHIKACEKHPMRAIERELALVRMEAEAVGSMLLDVQHDAIAKGKRITELESMTLADLERDAIRRALTKHRSVTRASKVLGIGRATLYRYARHHPEVLEGLDIVCSTPGENTK